MSIGSSVLPADAPALGLAGLGGGAARRLTPIGLGGPDYRHLTRLCRLMTMPAPLSDDHAADLIMLLGETRLRGEA